ncbi:hypothetical protein AMELA_G00243430 [Ameiurus melas]|uniref:Uncharacterized protein n=1 Tax=Ameiurus melas TaxID=219545 RepID=A0A7J5ZYR6_AMEME|nr:hypothetical protein AMELA_G00243430 [Ameiurus melas]
MENGAPAEISTTTTRASGDGEASAVKSGENPHTQENIPNGHAGAAPLENGEVRGEAGNGSSSFPVSLPAAGVACFPDSVEKPEGSALQSLRLSIPMQETELSSEPSLEMENEEKIRLEARRRLEEQLKQYRVQRHRERSHNRSSPKSRPCSTLDPELMLHPDILPRASTVRHDRVDRSRDSFPGSNQRRRHPGSQRQEVQIATIRKDPFARRLQNPRLHREIHGQSFEISSHAFKSATSAVV